jgi:hypothetical protein
MGTAEAESVQWEFNAKAQRGKGARWRRQGQNAPVEKSLRGTVI